MSTDAADVQGAHLSEAAFQSRVLDLATVYGWRVAHFRPAQTSKGWRTPVQGHRGFPDLVLARRGVVLLAELKSTRGRLGDGQAEWLEAIGDHGRLWRPRDWDSIQRQLRET